mgnify:CR=1 FL=1
MASMVLVVNGMQEACKFDRHEASFQTPRTPQRPTSYLSDCCNIGPIINSLHISTPRSCTTLPPRPPIISPHHHHDGARYCTPSLTPARHTRTSYNLPDARGTALTGIFSRDTVQSLQSFRTPAAYDVSPEFSDGGTRVVGWGYMPKVLPGWDGDVGG